MKSLILLGILDLYIVCKFFVVLFVEMEYWIGWYMGLDLVGLFS